MKFCLYPRCSARVPVGAGAYCNTHWRKRDREQRGSAVERGYDTRWKRESKAFLWAFPLCGMRPGGQVPVMSLCHAEHRATPATLVDHVQPHRGDETLFWDRENWQSLCRACHDAKTRAGR